MKLRSIAPSPHLAFGKSMPRRGLAIARTRISLANFRSVKFDSRVWKI